MIYNLVVILIIHFIADFLLQSRKMGRNKSKSIMWLSMHVGIYLIVLLISGIIFSNYVVSDGNLMPIVEYCILNAILHWCTDFVTSRASGFCYGKMLKAEANESDKENRRWESAFWGVIGFDQLIHGVTLLLTYQLLFV